ncbi:MAG: amidohydrolase family protein [Acidobacteriota bacterium]|nr:amidohydrolase family protein [Acidobacteriota bacterium]
MFDRRIFARSSQTRTIGILFILCFCTLVAPAQDLPPEVAHYADTVFYNGSVLTMDRDKPPFTVTEALAVRDGKILAVGDEDRILRMAGPDTRRMNLDGRALMPGIIDTHSHLYEYAIYKHPREYQRILIRGLRQDGFRYVTVNWRSRESALADLKRAAEAASPGDWIFTLFTTDVNADMTRPKALLEFTRHDLDSVVPDNPIFIITGLVGRSGIANTKLMDIITGMYGENISGYSRDDQGVLNGRFSGAIGGTVNAELVPQVPPELSAPLFKRELDEWVANGVTTVSSRLGGNYITTYAYMDRQGQLPLRLAYSHEVGRLNPFLERYLRRMGGIQGHGTDRMWMIGISISGPDGDPPGAPHGRGGNNCTTLTKNQIIALDAYGADGGCRWDDPLDPAPGAPAIVNRYGYRISGVHNIGDKAVLLSLNAYEKADQEKSIMGKRFAIDHGLMISQDNIRQASELGAMWSLQPFLLYKTAPIVAQVWGEEVAQRWTMPTKSLIDAGVKVTYGADRWSDPMRQPMWGLQVLVTRQAVNGTVYGEREKLDRSTALLMMTRWGAEYVLREEELGSLEPGKLADLIVLDKNPLDTSVPDEALSEIKVVTTLVGGEVVHGSLN